MPIFMDRHDLRGMTAAEIASAHKLDLATQELYGVKFLTYWFDDQRGTAFCLVDAPDKDVAQRVHHEAHGHVAGEIIEVSLAVVEAFLGRIQDPEPPIGAEAAEMDAGHRTIMFTDIVGSTSMTERLGDRSATELVRAHDSIVHRCLAKSGGREVKHTGDGIMASFASAADAVQCAMAVQREFRAFNSGNPEPLHVRIGLDSGEPVADGNDLFGSTVQLAARLCSAASGDQILVSENICRECGDASAFLRSRRRRLKGFSQLVSSFECIWVGSQTP